MSPQELMSNCSKRYLKKVIDTFSLLTQDNELFTFSDKQTFVINKVGLVSVRTVIDYQTLSTKESRQGKNLNDRIFSRLLIA